MKEAGVDAIVGGSDPNSRYLTNMRSVIADMGQPLVTIGVMPADPDKPIFAITPSVDIGRHSGSGREWPVLITYSGPTQPDSYRGMKSVPPGPIEAFPSRSWAKSATDPLTPVELGWERNQTSLPIANVASAQLGVKRALEELGLAKGRIAVDDGGFAASLPRFGMDGLTIMPGENLFRKIRLVKSRVEVDRMRTVSRLNDGAARAMIAQLSPGMSFEDVQAIFFTELARRGGRPEFIVAGMTSGLRSGRLVKHEPFLVDCCGNFDGYSGDWARTVVLGAPPRLLIERAKLLGRVAVEVTGILKPGVRYSEIRSRGKAIADKLGVTFPIGFGPHSVGLVHGDDPLRDDVPFNVRPDVALEPGMVITVDLPTIEPGWGSMHLESLILITADGAEWLDRFDDPLYEVNV
jgi:Xaa-Pro aminopeptidase